MTDLPTSRRYFAASNSSVGFKNYYADCFGGDQTDRLYIIKGGPGTGKSYFMKTVARQAEAHGYTVTEYACSSDPASLDGVLLKRPNTPTIGLLDGTAPHVWEPTVPGVREEIINLGAFWNSRQLHTMREAILTHATAKSDAYARAYAYLRAAGDMESVADSLVHPCVRQDALAHLAARMLRAVPGGEVCTTRPALRRAISMTGDACLHTFEAQSAAVDGQILILDDYYGLGAYLTTALVAVSRTRGLDLLVSYDPLCPHKVDGLFYPATGLSILVGHAEPPMGVDVRAISLRRYAEPDALRAVRGELRQARALAERLAEQARHSLATAATHHFELESIYSAAMDFSAKEAYTTRFCYDLFQI